MPSPVPPSMSAVPFSSTRSLVQLSMVVAVVVWLGGLLLTRGGVPVADEWIHFTLVDRMRRGTEAGEFGAWLTMIPGYHWTLAGAMRLLDVESLWAARLLSACSGVIAVWAFLAARRALRAPDARMAATQFALLPLLFPFVFLVYTDVLSLALVLLAWVAVLRGRFGWGAAAVCAAMLVRQNNVVWAAFLLAWACWPALRLVLSGERARAVDSMLPAWPLGLPLLAFLGYWAWNGSFAYSAAVSTMHPSGVVHAGNPFFALFLVALLLPLQTLQGLAAIARAARTRPQAWIVPVGIGAACFALFSPDHPFNRLALEVNLRNAWLVQVQDHTLARVVFSAMVAAGAGTLCVSRWLHSRASLMVPFALLFLSASWLVEPRYSLIPLALYLSLRQAGSARVEFATTALWAVAAVYLAYGIFDFRLII